MYITERIIALFTYIWVLFIVCFSIIKLGTRYIGKILLVYIVLLSIMSFFYVPSAGADLYRLIPVMHLWGNLSFSQVWIEMIKSPTPIYVLYMNLIGRTKIDGLLPAITCFLFYSNVFYVLKKSVSKYKLNALDASLLLFFFMSTGVLIEVISGIRTMLGFSFIAVCIYKEMVEDKPIFKNIIWYILASLLHPAVLALTVIRFVYLLFEKNTNNYQIVSKILSLVIVIAIYYFFGREYLIYGFEKGKAYIFSRSFSYFWEYLIGTISLMFIIYMEFLTSKLIKTEGDIESTHVLLGFCKFLSIILIVLFIEYNIFHRFVIFLSIIAIPLLANLLSMNNYRKVSKVKLRQLVLFLSCVLLVIACARGNLCSLKFFIL